MIAALLAGEHDVTCERRALDALARLERGDRFDAILCDLMMPEVNGFDVVATLQRNADTARIPILVVTAKQVTALDRSALNSRKDQEIQIVAKAGFNQSRFIGEVRRALLPR